MFDAAADLGRDGDGEGREPVHEVGGAIERIDDPDHIAVARGAAFLGQEGVVRVEPADGLDDVGLGRAIDLGDVVVATLRMDLDGFESGNGTDDDVAGTARGAHRDVQ
jgi:hypothetical protein